MRGRHEAQSPTPKLSRYKPMAQPVQSRRSPSMPSVWKVGTAPKPVSPTVYPALRRQESNPSLGAVYVATCVKA